MPSQRPPLQDRPGLATSGKATSGKAVSGLAGRTAVVVMVGLGLALAILAIAYQRGQTRRCLAFFGPEHARRMAAASHVELFRLAPSGVEGRLAAIDRRDVSTARGLVHLRRGLVEDANYAWNPDATDDEPSATARLPATRWTHAMRFSEEGSQQGETTIVLALPESAAARDAGADGADGWIAVVGAPGRVRLGRIAKGVDTWIRSSWTADRR